jgi:hypothetical protein
MKLVVTSEPAPATSNPVAKEDFQAEEEKVPVIVEPTETEAPAPEPAVEEAKLAEEKPAAAEHA